MNFIFTKTCDVVDELDSDDATDIIQEIEEIDNQKAKEIFDGLEEDDKHEINWLKRYHEDEAGSYMQTELFSANIQEKIQDSITRLKKAKESHELENIHQVYIEDDKHEINWLKRYHEDEAGSYMQTELFLQIFRKKFKIRLQD